jgi:hypothetical protein
MTQGELERVAREMRTRGLHSSWEELLVFSKDVIGSLVSAYQVLLKSMTLSDNTSNDIIYVRKVIRDKLARALTLLTSEAQVARWESEVLAGNNIVVTLEVEDSGLKKISHRRNRRR